jgi:hypothetical protein
MSVTLILATTGLSISKHYCGNSIIHTALGTEAKSCMPGMDMNPGCCDNQTETIILDEDFQVSHSDLKIIPDYEILIAYLVTVLAPISEQSNYLALISYDTGPPVSAEPLYVKVQSFLL